MKTLQIQWKRQRWDVRKSRRENRVGKDFNLNVCNILTHEKIQKEFHHLDSHMYIRVELRSGNQKRLSGGRQILVRQICKHGKRSGKNWVRYILWKITCQWWKSSLPTDSLRAFYKHLCPEWGGHSASCPPVAFPVEIATGMWQNYPCSGKDVV